MVHVEGPAGVALQLGNDLLSNYEKTMELKWAEARAEVARTFAALSQALMEKQMRINNEL